MTNTTTKTTKERQAGKAEERFEQMRHERYRLGERAEEQVHALLGTLAEIKDLDAHQRKEARRAGMQDLVDRTPAGTLLGGWLANRLGGRGGYAGLVTGLDVDKTLPELDRLAAKE